VPAAAREQGERYKRAAGAARPATIALRCGGAHGRSIERVLGRRGSRVLRTPIG
jgi:hypothetical protein